MALDVFTQQQAMHDQDLQLTSWNIAFVSKFIAKYAHFLPTIAAIILDSDQRIEWKESMINKL